jgi:hypothetical protein
LFLGDLSLSLRSRESRLHVDLKVLLEFLAVKIFHSLASAILSIAWITLLVETNEGKWLLNALLAFLGRNIETLDLAIL